MKIGLLTYLEENNILPKNQFGFRKSLGTEDALVHLTKQLYTSPDKNHKIIGVFMDISKVFDSISHSKLLSILPSLGIVDTSLSLFQSYLIDRQQQVKMNNCYSEEKIITNGVPQGTVISSTLYITYVSVLSKLKLNDQIISYADDTALLVTVNDWDVTTDHPNTQTFIIGF